MTECNKIAHALMDRYSAAVNANDSAAYQKLFTADAIRIPPGADPEYGPEQIAGSEQADYDVARWTIKMSLIDAKSLSEDWIFAFIHVDAQLEFYADGSNGEKHANKGFLLHRQPSGEWLISRYLWNLKDA